MRISKLLSDNSFSIFAVAFAALMVLPACSVNVKKGDNGEDKKVDINTPLGGSMSITVPMRETLVFGLSRGAA